MVDTVKTLLLPVHSVKYIYTSIFSTLTNKMVLYPQEIIEAKAAYLEYHCQYPIV